jgi:HD-GYP domain-containing protein (c-di-GMP phosphodiesterase class II)
MDLVDASVALHQQRTAFIAWELGKAADLSDEAIKRLFIAGLLHDIGALSPEEKIDLHLFDTTNTEDHCIRGHILLQTVPWLKSAANIVRHHHTEWHLRDELITSQVVLESQILFLADYLERSVNRNVYILHQDALLKDKIASLSGNSLHPDVVDLFRQLARREEFWLDLASPRLYSLLLHNGPYQHQDIDLESITTIGELFRNIIDFRSRFTSTHSSGVAECAAVLSKLFGFSDHEANLMRVAGNFHDIGKLAVPNSILNKPAALTQDEFAVMRQHTYHTFSIMHTIGGLQQIAEWAAFHHERLDGSGYPFHHKGSRIGTGSRIMAVADIFTAVAEDRPYRKGMEYHEIQNVLKKQSAMNFIDKRIVDLLIENYAEVHNMVKERQDITRDFYEQQFAAFRASTQDCICAIEK